MIEQMRDSATGLVRVTFDWSDKHGTCYDCGLPAAYSAPDRYGAGKRTVGADDTLLCSVCAAQEAAAGERIIWLFADEFADEEEAL